MTSVDEMLDSQRMALESSISKLAEAKLRSMDALSYCDSFVNSATVEAAYGDSLGFFGRMRKAGEALPEQFEALHEEPSIGGADRRVQPYIRSQLFIALMAELEDFLAQLLMLVLRAYPHKIKDKTIVLDEILRLGTIEAVIAEAATAELTNLFYASPKKYRRRIEEVLSMTSDVLEPLWPSYTEMKARRDIGLHNGWRQNEIYCRRLAEVRSDVPDSDFLGIDREYFAEALARGEGLVDTIALHCIGKFGRGEVDGRKVPPNPRMVCPEAANG
jgi:hypothetical protein